MLASCRSQKGHQIPWGLSCRQLCADMRVLRTEPGSIGRAALSFISWAVVRIPEWRLDRHKAQYACTNQSQLFTGPVGFPSRWWNCVWSLFYFGFVLRSKLSVHFTLGINSVQKCPLFCSIGFRHEAGTSDNISTVCSVYVQCLIKYKKKLFSERECLFSWLVNFLFRVLLCNPGWLQTQCVAQAGL